MSALLGTQFANASGLELQLGRFYDSTMPELGEKISDNTLFKCVNLTMQIKSAYWQNQIGRASVENVLLSDGKVNASAQDVNGPFIGMGQARAIKPLLLNAAVKLWNDEVAAQAAALPRQLVIDGLPYALHSAIIDAELVFEKVMGEENEPSLISFSTKHPKGDQLMGNYRLVVPI